MKTPRDITANDLIKALKPFGYEIFRQKGSHIRIRTELNGEHYETIPNHKPIKVGTLNAILNNNIAEHFDMTKEELIEQIF
jgi:predicted RNA binding protein YcfA (HicA-like mRNA interferase family)